MCSIASPLKWIVFELGLLFVLLTATGCIENVNGMRADMGGPNFLCRKTGLDLKWCG